MQMDKKNKTVTDIKINETVLYIIFKIDNDNEIYGFRYNKKTKYLSLSVRKLFNNNFIFVNRIFNNCYSSYMLWKKVRSYMTDLNWIKIFDDLYINNKLILIDINGNKYEDYDTYKGFFIQYNGCHNFYYIRKHSNNEILHKELKIEKCEND